MQSNYEYFSRFTTKIMWPIKKSGKSETVILKWVNKIYEKLLNLLVYFYIMYIRFFVKICKKVQYKSGV